MNLIRLADKLAVDIEQAVLDRIELNEKKYTVELAKDNAVKYNRRAPKSFEGSTGVVAGGRYDDALPFHGRVTAISVNLGILHSVNGCPE